MSNILENIKEEWFIHIDTIWNGCEITFNWMCTRGA